MGKKVVLVTGASGSMGGETLKQVMEAGKFKGLILLRKKKENEKFAKKMQAKYGDDIEVMFGDLSNYDDCVKCVEKADYILHCAAIIPPTSDHNPKLAESANFFGTKNLVDAISNSPRKADVKFVTIGSVAEYGNRNYLHPWGRVGDPLLPSAFDFYATTKLKAERYVLETDIPNWVVLRQSGILHDNLLKNNMDDGLMFHTCWNVPIEWATSRDSGLMLRHLVEYDSEGKLPKEFWRRVYNIGGGESCRVTGYDTVNRGFEMMGASAKLFFKPNWNAARNFHCFWYYDSDVLNDYLNFRTESFEDFFVKLEKKCWYFKFGKIVPKSWIRKLAIERLFKDSNAPMFWLEHNLEGRIEAFFGSREKYNEIPSEWDNYPLLIEGNTPTGKIDYNELRDITKAKKLLLSHGYDESKPDSELDIADMKQAAQFRGGKCLSEKMVKGDLFTKLKWACHDGHTFESSPYTILKAGHWCPDCCEPAPWNFDALAKKIPFFAQVWYDTHDKDENAYYAADCYMDMIKADEAKI